MATKPLPDPNDPNSRFKRRKLDADDDDDDDRPGRKSGKKGGDGPSPFLFLGVGGVLLLFLGCCSGGVYLTFFSSSLFAPDDVTITTATRQRSPGLGKFGPKGFQPGTSETIAFHFKCSSGVKPGTKVIPVVRLGNRTMKFPIRTIQPRQEAQDNLVLTDVFGMTGKMELWFEDERGNKVSNVYSVN